ncbi:uncharacterized protein LY79DRAFT_362556 [Colletotrichum navitas]|uniref:Uncharacterized protein n=1 Tax=Colletotrichum navitas TaxID=681940 RepID=A0AAD8PQS0_9PEZI|nr:uncharacterized protein LY79DRAFT_362556 [Colletotrichum navitas]KAK1574689.1 hypothetical protein LY79DRAFT_362556 [Colletotrichum navitas]
MQPAPKLKVSPIYPSSTIVGRSGPQHTATRTNSLPAPVFDPRELIFPETCGSLYKCRRLRCVPRRLRPPPAMYPVPTPRHALRAFTATYPYNQCTHTEHAATETLKNSSRQPRISLERRCTAAREPSVPAIGSGRRCGSIRENPHVQVHIHPTFAKIPPLLGETPTLVRDCERCLPPPEHTVRFANLLTRFVHSQTAACHRFKLIVTNGAVGIRRSLMT